MIWDLPLQLIFLSPSEIMKSTSNYSFLPWNFSTDDLECLEKKNQGASYNIPLWALVYAIGARYIKL